MKILIGGAWPYANGSLHIGHIASLLPGDVIARFYRLKGEEVCYVSGSDCHGTPITIKAKQEIQSPSEISEKYHKEFIKGFKYFGFSYDYYGKTSSKEHKEFVRKFHRNLYNSDYIYEKEEPQAYCDVCKRFLPDRLVEGICPNCGAKARGDQCNNCGNIYQPEELLDIRCIECDEPSSLIKSRHLFLAITELENQLKKLVGERIGWRKNAISFTNKYIKEGLRDRAITRDLDWGIDVPFEGYEDKKIYIWSENVLGYLSSTYLACNKNKSRFNSYWKNNARHYYVHGKDNIPFHTIILPSLLIANNKNYDLPDYIISSEYLTLEGRKISTSENWAIWVKDIIGKYNPDSLRYFFISNGPEKRDADFSWREFFNTNNGELLGAYGNFVNRTLVFIKKSFDSKVPIGIINKSIQLKVVALYNKIDYLITKGDLKKALRTIFDFIRFSNKYFDDEKPWISIKNNKEKCENTLFNCVYIIINLAILLEPFLPFSSAKIINWFGIKKEWKEQIVSCEYKIPEIEILFDRLDKKTIEDEIEKLTKS